MRVDVDYLVIDSNVRRGREGRDKRFREAYKRCAFVPSLNPVSNRRPVILAHDPLPREFQTLHEKLRCSPSGNCPIAVSAKFGLTSLFSFGHN